MDPKLRSEKCAHRQMYRDTKFLLLVLLPWEIKYRLCKNQRFFLFCQNKLEIEFLQDENPLIILSPYHPSSDDELKWIDMGYHQGLAKENIVSQF